MQRLQINPRSNWQATVESQGFYFHTPEEKPYWDESAYYQFTSAQIDELEKATYALDKMCLTAVQHVIDNSLFDSFQIPVEFHELVKRSWLRDETTIYGRFDLCYDGQSPPKLLEYNADTPTSLLEAAVIQWQWMKDVFPKCDQFNSIHERLIGVWKSIGPAVHGKMYFSSISGNVEDYITVNYLRDAAMQAGLETTYIEMERIGWNASRREFVNEQEEQIASCFKLYPWEWMIRERFGQELLNETTYWLESPWKMLLSNKAILPVLWELFPQSPYLLGAWFDQPANGSYVRKPILAREGANIQIVIDGVVASETDGPYAGPYVYQQYCPLPKFNGGSALVGSWMVNGYACGIGIREDTSAITGNLSRFVPHIF